MVYTVEVRRIDADLAQVMIEMRVWLDHHRIDPAIFDHQSAGPEIIFQVRFHSEGDALAFARAFYGRLDNGGDPDGRAFRPITDPPPI